MPATQFKTRPIRRKQTVPFMGTSVNRRRPKPAVEPKNHAGPVLAPGTLPGWSDLSGRKQPKRVTNGQVKQETAVAGGFKTVKFAVAMLVLVTAGTLYVSHVYATQRLLEDVQLLRRQNTQLHLDYNRIRGSFDEMTGPRETLRQAQRLGLREGYAYGQTIWID